MKNRKRMVKRGLAFTSIAAGVLVVAGLGVRQAVAEMYYVPLTSMEPEIPAGARVLVYKLADRFGPGEIVAYRHTTGEVYLGRVDAVDPAGATLTVHRNGTGPLDIPEDNVIGRVVLTTR